MKSNAREGRRVLGSLRTADGRGVVRVEDRFDTDIDDLWSALTDPRRLARWLGEAPSGPAAAAWRAAAQTAYRAPEPVIGLFPEAERTR